MANRKKMLSVFWMIITVIPILGMIWGIINPTNYGYWQGIAQNYFVKFAIFAPLVFILIQIIQVIIAPISHYTVGLIGGYFFGFGWGGFYNYIGRLIGHSCAFFIAKRVRKSIDNTISTSENNCIEVDGTEVKQMNIISRFFKWFKEHIKKWVCCIIDNKTLKQYDKIFSGNEESKGVTIQSIILFLIYFLPLFPDDEISYLVGFSKMKYRWFFWANICGQLGGSFSLALLGNGIDTKDPWFWILTIVTLVAFPAMWVGMKKYYSLKNKKTNKCK
ncbi:MAG: VTT domain-containing protein [Prevotellaceae bacterium]|jgi:uncharacterized membrane protein YdjX (TVP38/TMEM64 family)|nr:VTT domain-containing protein [Prevotellaceae bacterium]